MYKKKFNNNDQLKFSKLTGDLNPIHLYRSYEANTLFQKVGELIKSIENKLKS